MEENNNFEMELGGETVSPSENLGGQAENLTPENEKFFRCKFRSEKTTYWVPSACGCQPGSMVDGFICNKLDVKNLNPLICKVCSQFISK